MSMPAPPMDGRAEMIDEISRWRSVLPNTHTTRMVILSLSVCGVAAGGGGGQGEGGLGLEASIVGGGRGWMAAWCSMVHTA